MISPRRPVRKPHRKPIARGEEWWAEAADHQDRLPCGHCIGRAAYGQGRPFRSPTREPTKCVDRTIVAQRSCIHVEPTGPAPEATSSGGAPSGTVGNRYEGARRGAFPRREASAASGTTAEMRNDGAPSCGFPEGTDGVPRWPATHQGPVGRPRGRRRGPCAPARRATDHATDTTVTPPFARRRRIRRKVHDGRPQGLCVNAQLWDICPLPSAPSRH